MSPHYSLKTKKVVIRSPYIIDCTDEGLLKGLKVESVMKPDTILIFRDAKRKPPGPFILTFYSQKLPN